MYGGMPALLFPFGFVSSTAKETKQKLVVQER